MNYQKLYIMIYYKSCANAIIVYDSTYISTKSNITLTLTLKISRYTIKDELSYTTM